MKHQFAAMAVLAICTLLAAGRGTQAVFQDHSPRDKALTKFLQNYDGNPTSADQRTTRYAVVYVDLNDDGAQEAIVYLISAGWCGSGGCSCLILEPEGSSFRIITRTTITQLPIRVLTQKTNGWHDLAVGVGGGGIRSGYEARLKFNGKKYPSNPSVPPAQKLQKPAEGKTVISENTTGIPLYSD